MKTRRHFDLLVRFILYIQGMILIVKNCFHCGGCGTQNVTCLEYTPDGGGKFSDNGINDCPFCNSTGVVGDEKSLQQFFKALKDGIWIPPGNFSDTLDVVNAYRLHVLNKAPIEAYRYFNELDYKKSCMESGLTPKEITPST